MKPHTIDSVGRMEYFRSKTGTMKNGHFLSTLLLTAAVLPYVAVSCREEEAPEPSVLNTCTSEISLTRSAASSLSELNTFVYFSDSAGLLDSFSYIGDFEEEAVSVSSTSGERRIVMTANFPSDRIPYEDALDYASLCSIVCDIADDSPQAPFMSGEILCRTGPGSGHRLILEPMLARVAVSSFTVDFSGHPYRNSTLENTKAYITNVNGLCHIAGEADAGQSSIYNYGAYDPEGCKRLAHPEMLYCEPVSSRQMYCYPNSVAKGGAQVLGRAVTRLVIEGTIDGTTWYYPISIGERGVERGKSYLFDIKITGTGTSDPDTEVESGMAEIKARVENWMEYDEEIEEY